MTGEEIVNILNTYIETYRTDELGTIVITTDGEKIQFNTESGDYMYRKVKK